MGRNAPFFYFSAGACLILASLLISTRCFIRDLLRQGNCERDYEHDDGNDQSDLEHQQEFRSQGKHIRVAQPKLRVAAESRKTVVPDSGLPFPPAGRGYGMLGENIIIAPCCAVAPGARAIPVYDPIPRTEEHKIDDPQHDRILQQHPRGRLRARGDNTQNQPDFDDQAQRDPNKINDRHATLLSVTTRQPKDQHGSKNDDRHQEFQACGDIFQRPYDYQWAAVQGEWEGNHIRQKEIMERDESNHDNHFQSVYV
jgi:hypothetical protein